MAGLTKDINYRKQTFADFQPVFVAFQKKLAENIYENDCDYGDEF